MILICFFNSSPGPYSGRSPDLIKKLRGVLTNPNCEYGANFVAIHSLAAWSKTTVDGCSNLSATDPVSADIKLELSADSTGEAGDDSAPQIPPPPGILPPHVYHPRAALRAAVKDWISEFSRTKTMWGPIMKPQVGLTPTGILQPGINTCLTTTTATNSLVTPQIAPNLSSTGNGDAASPIPAQPGQTNTLVINPAETSSLPTASQPATMGTFVTSSFAPIVPMMNSLVSANEVVLERQQMAEPVKAIQPEPMETNLETEGN